VLDATGFKRPRYEDIFAEMETKSKTAEAFGPEANTAESTPLGAILRVGAYFFAQLWEGVEDVYNSGYKNTAAGVQLEKLGPYVGVRKTQAQRATGILTITGTSGFEVAAGFRVATGAGIIFETTAAVRLAGGTGAAMIQALEAGTAGNVPAGTITTIVNPSADVTAISNAAETSGGREKETDEEFRSKWDKSVAGGGSATVDAIRSAVLRVSGVRAATVFENNTMTPTSEGQPGKSYQTFVLGGEPQAIGEAIFSRGAGGIETYGTESVTVTDLSGRTHSVMYSPAVVVRVYGRITVSKNASYPADGDVRIRSVLVRFVGGEDADGTIYAGLSMGDDVIYTRLIAAMYAVPGVDDVALELSTDGVTFAPANNSISPSQVAQLDIADIEVTS